LDAEALRVVIALATDPGVHVALAVVCAVRPQPQIIMMLAAMMIARRSLASMTPLLPAGVT
jgi:hypothetical protein